MVYFHGHIGVKIVFWVSRLFLIPILQYVAKVTNLLEQSGLLLPGRFKEPGRAKPTTGVGNSDPSRFSSMVT